ncbi:MAG: hypothetical protein ACLGIG_05985 [Actinomycetes bacterium]
MLFTVVYLVLCAPALVVVVDRAVEAAERAGTTAVDARQVVPAWAAVWLTVAVLILDMVGTFVTPALVYSTWRVTEAVRLGVRLLRRSWPHAAVYVVVPPLALVLLNQVAQPAWLLGAVGVVVAALLNLLVKGAVAAYYLRVMPVPGADGALKPKAPAYSAAWPDQYEDDGIRRVSRPRRRRWSATRAHRRPRTAPRTRPCRCGSRR